MYCGRHILARIFRLPSTPMNITTTKGVHTLVGTDTTPMTAGLSPSSGFGGLQFGAERWAARGPVWFVITPPALWYESNSSVNVSWGLLQQTCSRWMGLVWLVLKANIYVFKHFLSREVCRFNFTFVLIHNKTKQPQERRLKCTFAIPPPPPGASIPAMRARMMLDFHNFHQDTGKTVKYSVIAIYFPS